MLNGLACAAKESGKDKATGEDKAARKDRRNSTESAAEKDKRNRRPRSSVSTSQPLTAAHLSYLEQPAMRVTVAAHLAAALRGDRAIPPIGFFSRASAEVVGAAQAAVEKETTPGSSISKASSSNKHKGRDNKNRDGEEESQTNSNWRPKLARRLGKKAGADLLTPNAAVDGLAGWSSSITFDYTELDAELKLVRERKAAAGGTGSGSTVQYNQNRQNSVDRNPDQNENQNEKENPDQHSNWADDASSAVSPTPGANVASPRTAEKGVPARGRTTREVSPKGDGDNTSGSTQQSRPTSAAKSGTSAAISPRNGSVTGNTQNPSQSQSQNQKGRASGAPNNTQGTQARGLSGGGEQASVGSAATGSTRRSARSARSNAILHAYSNNNDFAFQQ